MDQNPPNLTRRDFLKTAALTAGTAVAGCSGPLLSSADEKPNILYLMTDQHRGDCLGCDGNSLIKTPNLDSIAKDGVVFSNAYSSVPSCTPARSGILTGLSPWHHGMLGYGRMSSKYPFKLPQALRNAGYYTFGIGKMHWYPQKTLNGFYKTLVDESGRVETPGFISDYRRWFKAQAPDLDPDATGIGWNDYRTGVYALPEQLHPTHWTSQMAVDFIDSYNKPQPFMLKVSFARPHSPYDPPKRFMDAYNESDMPAPFLGKWAAKFADHNEPAPYNLWHGDLGAAQAKKSRRGYYGSISFIDEQIGRIIDALKKGRMYDNTLIVFFADHGDMLGDHHHWRKTYAYEGSAKIPMLLRWPKKFGHDHMRGKTLTQTTEHRDILPTFLDAAGADIPPHIDGMSLLNLVRGRDKDWRSFIDLEHALCYENSTNWNALTDGRFKYIYHSSNGWEQLFDMLNDSGEINDLATDPKHQPTLKAWRQRLINHFAERGPAFVSDGKLTIRKDQMLYSPLFPK